MSSFLNKGKSVYAHLYNKSKELIVRLLYLQDKPKDTSFRVVHCFCEMVYDIRKQQAFEVLPGFSKT